MEETSAPKGIPYDVWFVPASGTSLRLGTPLRLGLSLIDYADALRLAEAAAADLPAYGFPDGQVLITKQDALVRIVGVVRDPAHDMPVDTPQSTTTDTLLRQAIARVALEDLLKQACRAEPTQAAPPAWIACLDAALLVIAKPDEQRRYRLDGLHCVTIDFLQRRVAAVLRQFDQLTAANMPLQVHPGNEHPLTL